MAIEHGIFEHVLAGVDESAESAEAARQAARLLAPDGRLELIAVVDSALAVHAGWAAGTVLTEIEQSASRALEQGLTAAGMGEGVLVEGDPAGALLDQARDREATLVAVGMRGRSRAVGTMLGTVAARLVHEAPCSVLVARPAGASFPRSIAVGLDGSTHAAPAADIAAALAERFDVPLRTVVATGGKAVDTDGLRGRSDLMWDERDPVTALVDASANFDLVVVGSRGLHGVAALGSVSERVAHRSTGSVLVVRAPAP